MHIQPAEVLVALATSRERLIEESGMLLHHLARELRAAQASPWKSTHNDLRFAVEALSGGFPLTVYADCWKSIQLGSDNFSRELTISRDGTGDAEKRPSVNVGGGRGWRFKKDADDAGHNSGAAGFFRTHRLCPKSPQAGDSASTGPRPTAGFRGALRRRLQNALIWMVKKG